MTDLLWTLAAFILTLMVFSYLFGDNVLFRIASYLLVGATAGYAVVVILDAVLLPRLVQPLLAGSTAVIVPALLSILLLMRLSPRLAGMGRFSMALLVGVGAAVAITGAVLGTIVPQIQGTVSLFAPAGGLPAWMQGLFIVLGAAAVLVYFQFGAIRRTDNTEERSPALKWLARIGEWLLAITLGAVFAGVLLAALGALIERVDFIRSVIMGWF